MSLKQSLLFATLTAAIVLAIFAQGIHQNAIQNPYKKIEDGTVNLTKAEHRWKQIFFRDGKPVEESHAV